MKKIELTTTTYQIDKLWRVDIITNFGKGVKANGVTVEQPKCEAWLYRIDYGIKSLMFGLSKSSTITEEEFLRMVENEVDSYKDDYMTICETSYDDTRW